MRTAGDGSFACSGSIIAARWVLTARHCIGGTMSVRVGSVYRASGGVTRTVSATYGRYDLGLLYLSSAVSTTYVTLASANPPATDYLLWDARMPGFGVAVNSPLPTATVQVRRLMAVDAEAYRAAWAFIFGIDLVGSIEARDRPIKGYLQIVNLLVFLAAVGLGRLDAAQPRLSEGSATIRVEASSRKSVKNLVLILRSPRSAPAPCRPGTPRLQRLIFRGP